MAIDLNYREDEIAREEIDNSRGSLILEFGQSWCGHCQALLPYLESILESHPEVRHIRVADGKGKRLGRSFRVKLWPTLFFIWNGDVVSELVRPSEIQLKSEFIEFLNNADRPSSF